MLRTKGTGRETGAATGRALQAGPPPNLPFPPLVLASRAGAPGVHLCAQQRGAWRGRRLITSPPRGLRPPVCPTVLVACQSLPISGGHDDVRLPDETGPVVCGRFTSTQ